MGLDIDLISQFVKANKDDTPDKNEAIVLGEVKKLDGITYVKLDGSEQFTPVSSTANAEDGDRVTVLIKNHTATVTGNVSSPAPTSKEVSDQITEFEIVVADKISTDVLEAKTAIIDELSAENVVIHGRLDASEAVIDDLTAKTATITEQLTAANASIENLEATKLSAEVADITYATIEGLEATDAEIYNLKGTYGEFVDLTAEKFRAIEADIQSADIKYANIDFANIGDAAIENFLSKSGMVGDLVVNEGTVTGTLVGVTIKGDLIEAGTVVADRLVIEGEDGLYYQLNTNGESVSTQQTEYNSLNGSIITAQSVTADKVNVTDLSAFEATIGGFNITDNSLYSGVKESVNNTTRGVYLDKTGQIAFGDKDNYIKYYKDQNGVYRLAISAESIIMKSGGSSGGDTEESTDLSTTIDDIKQNVEDLRNEITTLLRIESSRGTVFKNDNVSTVLSVVIYHGTERITTSEAMKKTFGNGAYLQWKWQRIDDETFGTILSSDPRFGDNGFTFTLSPEDVDTKVTFMCELIT